MRKKNIKNQSREREKMKIELDFFDRKNLRRRKE